MGAPYRSVEKSHAWSPPTTHLPYVLVSCSRSRFLFVQRAARNTQQLAKINMKVRAPSEGDTQAESVCPVREREGERKREQARAVMESLYGLRLERQAERVQGARVKYFVISILHCPTMHLSSNQSSKQCYSPTHLLT